MFDVSVIIPNYNGAAFLKQAIDSALNQQGVNVEVIVVDDGSKDSSREILDSYGSRIKVFYQENKGAPAARNLGLENASALLVKFLDADDVLLPGVLRDQVNHCMELKEEQIPYGQAIWTDEYLNKLPGYPVNPIEEGQDPIHHIFTQNPLTSAPLHRKNLLKKIGGFDTDLVKGQEFDLHLRLVLADVQFVYKPILIYYFRQHSSVQRISHYKTFQKGEQLLQMCKKQETLIEAKIGTMPGKLKSELAKRYWLYGRAVLRSGNYDLGKKFFDNANRLDKHLIAGGFFYRLSVSIVGIFWTERFIKFIKK
jgi:glycosyltransferase involved in cell wall biosynthesis